jgi:hypothetical protein
LNLIYFNFEIELITCAGAVVGRGRDL